MSKVKRQFIRAGAVSTVLVVAMLATLVDARSNPGVFFLAHFRQVAIAYVTVFLLCWGVDAGFAVYFPDNKMTIGQKVKLGVILAIAFVLTTVAFYYDWKYDHAPGANNGPLLKSFLLDWPVFAIYAGIISFLEVVLYLCVKLLVGEVVRLYKFIRRSFIQ